MLTRQKGDLTTTSEVRPRIVFRLSLYLHHVYLCQNKYLLSRLATLGIYFNIYFQASMAKMPFGTFLFCTNHIDTPFEEDIKTLTRVSFIVTPIPLDETLKLSKKLFNWI